MRLRVARRFPVVAFLMILCGQTAVSGAEPSRVAVSTGWGGFTRAGTTDSLPVLQLEWERPISDGAAFRLAGAGGWNPGGSDYFTSATLGLFYAIDTTQYIPYVAVGVGGAVLSRDGVRTWHLLPEFGVGLDVVVTTRLRLGISLRGELAEISEATALAHAGIRLVWRLSD